MLFKMAADNGNIGKSANKFLQGLVMFSNKGRTLKKILRRIAAKSKLRKNREFATFAPGLLSPGNYLATIVAKIPNYRV
jgi:hypothetical protein